MGDFNYGHSNDYAGTNLCNLDVTLSTRRHFAPQAKVIVFVHPSEETHVAKLVELFPIHAVLKYPVTAQEMQAALQAATE